MSLTWWVRAPIVKLACPSCKKRTENYVLGENDGIVTVKCMKCGTVHKYDKSKSDVSDNIAEDFPDLPCYG